VLEKQHQLDKEVYRIVQKDKAQRKMFLPKVMNFSVLYETVVKGGLIPYKVKSADW